MIVRNEAAHIDTCLNSVKNVVDEMIIVDTGSTDQTVEICQAAGATLLHYEWDDNFAAARNLGLEQATGDWILCLDADEEVDAEDAAKLRNLLTETKEHMVGVQVMNYYGADPPDPNHAYLEHHYRLFRNRMGFRFKNQVHELLNVGEVLGELNHLKSLPVKIHHYGYMDATMNDKHNRNIQILERMKLEDSSNPWIDYYLATGYYRLNMHQIAFRYTNEAIQKFLQKQEIPPPLLYKLKYEILVMTNSFDGAWPAIDRAIALYPDYVDLHFYRGLIFFGKEKYEEAIKVFQHCLMMGDSKVHPLPLKGAGSYQAWYCLGLCYLKLGQKEQAALAFLACLEFYPDHIPAKEELEKISPNPSK